MAPKNLQESAQSAGDIKPETTFYHGTPRDKHQSEPQGTDKNGADLRGLFVACARASRPACKLIRGKNKRTGQLNESFAPEIATESRWDACFRPKWPLERFVPLEKGKLERPLDG